MSLYGKAMLEEFPWLHVGFMVFCRFYFPFYLHFEFGALRLEKVIHAILLIRFIEVFIVC